MVDLGARFAVADRPPARMGRVAAPAGTHLAFDVTLVSAIARLLPEWAAIANRAASDNLFFHPDFALPAIAHLGRDVAVATISRPDGRLAALAPFTRTRLGRVAPAARLWSHDYGPLGMPLIEEGAIEPVAAALIDGLAPDGSGRSVIVPDLPLEGPVAAALVSAALRQGRRVDILDRHSRAVLDRPLAGTIDLRAALPPRRRKEYGRQMRRLADLGVVSMETISEADQMATGFEAFMALEAAGWKGRQGTALLCSEATVAFAREAVANRAAAGGVRIDAITLDGKPIAMLVSFVAGTTAFTWKIAYDEAYARFSPGVQMMLDVPAMLFADPAVMRVDSCAAADHPMIDHLWPGRMTVGTLVLGPPGGSVLHRIALAAARAEIAARAAVRRLRH